MEEIILETKELCKQYHKQTVLKNINMRIPKGCVYGLLGANGAGKSTFMKILMGEYDSDAGTIELNGKEVHFTDSHQALSNGISMIFQDPMTALDPVYTIGSQIMEVINAHQKMSKAEAKEYAVKVLKMVGIPEAEKRLKSYPHEFSGGMRQRVIIAMAIACNPKLIIADEPTTALDVTIQAQILKLINKMKKELNTAVLLITHDMGVISEMADNVIVMYAGKIVEYTNVEDLFKNPLHPYTIGLRRSIPDIDSDDQEELEVIPGSVPMLYELPKGCFFAPRCKHAKEICHQECPAMMEHGENHLVRCWKYHERWNKEDVENGK